MNTDLANENQGLQYDNKQLNALLKEYEQTLDNVMASFRKRAVSSNICHYSSDTSLTMWQHDVQLQELETIKQFETKLVSAETSSLNTQLNVETSVSVLIAECSRLLRMVLRLMGGEEPASSSQPSTPPEMDFIPSTSSSNMLEMRCAPELANPVPTDWALEREIELARLEQENAELRMLLQASQSASESTSLPPSLPRVPSARVHSLMPRRQKVFRAQYPPDDPNVIELHLQPHEGRRDMVTLSDEIL